MIRQIIAFTSIFLLLTIIISACGNKKKERLPVLGRKTIETKIVGGVEKNDTLYHEIKEFEFINQDSSIVNNDTFSDKIYIADFFFTTCPTICPLMKAQMLRVYEEFKNNENVLILSHTIDPAYDTVGVLREFASKLGVSSDSWHFVTGDREKIYDMAQSSYMVTALADENEPGGYIHSGAFILVDKERHIRGLYDGTKAEDVNRLMEDILILLDEYGPPE